MGHCWGLFCEGVAGISIGQAFRLFSMNAQTLADVLTARRPVSRTVPDTRGWMVNNHVWDEWMCVERGSAVG